MALPPAPGPAAWFEPTMRQLGPVLSLSEHTEWSKLIAELATLPQGVRAIVWVRRRDRRGRETVGLLINSAHTPNGVVLIDAAHDAAAVLEHDSVIALHLIRYR